MSETGSGSKPTLGPLPPGGQVILVLALFIGGALLVTEPYRSARPSDPSQRIASSRSPSLLEIDLRAWQDPFEAVKESGGLEQKALAQVLTRLAVTLSADQVGEDRASSAAALHPLTADIVDCVRSGRGVCTILPVLVDGSNYADARENRRRDRYALLAALRSQGFVPRSTQRIGLWQPVATPGGSTFQVPFEVFDVPKEQADAANRKNTSRGGMNVNWRAYVLWVDEASLAAADPIGDLGELLAQLLALQSETDHARSALSKDELEKAKQLKIKVLGPSSSDTLLRLNDFLTVRSAKAQPKPYTITELSGARVRTEPTTNSEQVTTLAKGSQVLVSRGTSVGGETWLGITTDSVQGWVRSDLLQADQEGIEIDSSAETKLADAFAGALGDAVVVWLRNYLDTPPPAEELQVARRAVVSTVTPSYRRSKTCEERWVATAEFGEVRLPEVLKKALPRVKDTDSQWFNQVAGSAVADVLWGHGCGEDLQEKLQRDEIVALIVDQLKFYSHRATSELSGAKIADSIKRTVLTDPRLVDVIMEDLDSAGRKASSNEPKHLMLVTEWDTNYSRNIEQHLRTKLLDKRYKLRFEVHVLYYLRGIDGLRPSSSESPSGDGDKTSIWQVRKATAKGIEHPVGGSQMDYLRRMTANVGEGKRPGQDSTAKSQSIDAVLVVGTDVYDKLLVIQALRPILPRALFYSTDLDARFFHPDQYPWTHNVRIASSYGLKLGSRLQAGFPPFRDSYQTAMYATAREALGDGTFEKDSLGSLLSPRLFEVAREREIDLPLEGQMHDSILFPSREAFRSPNTLRTLITFLVSFLLVALFLRGSEGAIRLGAAHDPQHPRYYVWHLVVILVVLVVTLSVLNFPVWWSEPLVLFEGVSTYGSCLMFALVVLLMAHFFSVTRRRAMWDMQGIETELKTRHAIELSATRGSGRPRASEWSETVDDDSVRVNSLWSLLWRDLQWDVKKIAWTAIAAILVLLSASPVFFPYGLPRVPAEGPAEVLTVVAGILAFVLVFCSLAYCVWFIQSVSRFESFLSRYRSDWMPDKPESGPVGPEVREMGDLLVVVRTTEVAGRLLFWPFVAAVLLPLAGNSFFDGWYLGLGVGCIYVFLFAVVGWSTIRLRNLAEATRRGSIGRLEVIQWGLLGTKDEALKKVEHAISKIKDERGGAFAPLREQAAVRLLVIPVGGATTLAILEYVAASGVIQ